MIIKTDNGSQPSQIDLIAIKNEHEISIEITQYVDPNYRIVKDEKRGKYLAKKTEREWYLSVNNNIAQEIDREVINNIDNVLCRLEMNYPYEEAIELQLASVENKIIQKEITKLQEVGVCRIFSKANSNGNRLININLFGSASFSIASKKEKEKILDSLLQIAYTECSKADIQKKFKYSSTEKHLFIPLAFSLDKGQYAHWFFEHWEFLKDDATTLNEENLPDDYKIISEVTDTIWISTIYCCTSSNEVGFNLIRITKQNKKFIFDYVYHQEPYSNIIKQ